MARQPYGPPSPKRIYPVDAYFPSVMQLDSEKNHAVAKEMARQYMNAYRLMQGEILQTTGKLPEPYKEMERKVLERFFGEMVRETCNGLDFCAKLLSGLIINQALPNTNHRTSAYFLVSLLRQHGFSVDLVQNAKEIREYFLDSKHILKKGRRDFQEAHFESTRQFLVNILEPTQSGKLGNMRAKSFIDSFRASSNDMI